MITNKEKWHYLAVKILTALISQTHFAAHLSHKINLKSMKSYVKFMIISLQECLKKKVYENIAMETSL